VKTTFGGDNLNKVGAAVGKSGEIIQKSLNEFGKAFLDLSKTAFGV
jgi:transcription antitermination factor NusA-like protein